MTSLLEVKRAAVASHLALDEAVTDLANYMAENGYKNVTSGNLHYDALRALIRAETAAKHARTLVEAL